ncbi:hypothetical protein L915_21783, partial [Phytophthora nicotianae]
MSTASDISAFEHSVEPAPAETLFRDNKWTYIQDSSNTGQYAGQIQLNLSTISSQAAFVNWEEAVIELPIKLQITNSTGSSVISTGACSIDQLVPVVKRLRNLENVRRMEMDQSAARGRLLQVRNQNHHFDSNHHSGQDWIDK